MAKTLTLKYAGSCAGCGADLEQGTEAIWHRRGVVTCLTCKPEPMTAEEYAARKAAKVERYQGYADNARSRSDAAYQTTRDIVDMIPLGQPILVGHHSESRHRRDIGRMESNMRRSVDESRKADYWENRAQAAARGNGIESHDPEAADKLRAKIADLEAHNERAKAINKAARKAGFKKGDPITLELLDSLDLTDNERRSILDHARFSPGHNSLFPGYVVTNRSANIRRYKQRLAELTA